MPNQPKPTSSATLLILFPFPGKYGFTIVCQSYLARLKESKIGKYTPVMQLHAACDDYDTPRNMWITIIGCLVYIYMLPRLRLGSSQTQFCNNINNDDKYNNLSTQKYNHTHRLEFVWYIFTRKSHCHSFLKLPPGFLHLYRYHNLRCSKGVG